MSAEAVEHTQYAIKMQSIPEISEEERRSRLYRAYQIILECAQREADDDHLPKGPDTDSVIGHTV